MVTDGTSTSFVQFTPISLENLYFGSLLAFLFYDHNFPNVVEKLVHHKRIKKCNT